MALRLYGRALEPLGVVSPKQFIGRITTNAASPERDREILRVTDASSIEPGFRGYLFDQAPSACPVENAFLLGADWRYLAEGDIVRIDPARCTLRALYRRSSNSNFLLVTERCDNFCVMCSQPPKERDDSWLVDELQAVIPLIDPATPTLGITGGEPALLGSKLIDLLTRLRARLPATAVHVLTNGRAFVDPSFADAIAAIDHPDLMLGIPLYSALPEEHDYVVQAVGAYDETVQGIINLKRAGVRVELRFVIHAETVAQLTAFAQFVARNLVFVDHVALMGLELTGFAKTNLDTLWVDPMDYQQELANAAGTLTSAGLRTSIYNHQLCVLPSALKLLARRSVSDWKNVYLETCNDCSRQSDCGGFFSSSHVRLSRGIAPYREHNARS